MGTTSTYQVYKKFTGDQIYILHHSRKYGSYNIPLSGNFCSNYNSLIAILKFLDNLGVFDPYHLSKP